MKYKFILVLLLILSSLFYWYEIRPSKIRSYCSWSVRWEVGKSECKDNPKCYEKYYPICLEESGLNAENTATQVRQSDTERLEVIHEYESLDGVESQLQEMRNYQIEQEMINQRRENCESTGGVFSGKSICTFN